MMKVDQFAQRNPRTSSSEDTGGWNPPDGCEKGPLSGCLLLISQVTCLRESCMRENRTCSLGGGRRLAHKRAFLRPDWHPSNACQRFWSDDGSHSVLLALIFARLFILNYKKRRPSTSA